MSFDPYRTWFGLNPQGTPPNHYRLLGLKDFESDPERIQSAALARLAKLRKHQVGKHADLAQQLMNEVAQARLCLTDPARKSKYDLDLEIALDRDSAQGSGRQRSSLPVVLAVLLLAGGIGISTLVWRTLKSEKTHADSQALSQPKGESAGEEQAIAEGVDPVDHDTPRPTSTAAKIDKSVSAATQTKEMVEASTPGFIRRIAIASEQKIDSDSTQGTSIPLRECNSGGDEDAPAWVNADGTIIAFNSKRLARELAFARRMSPSEPFTEIGTWRGLPSDTDFSGFCVSNDGLTCWFATSMRQELMTAHRDDIKSSWQTPVSVMAKSEAIKGAWPSVTGDGKELFFTEFSAQATTIKWARRKAADEPFEQPISLGLPKGFERPSVTADGKALYCQGPTSAGPPTIYRIERRSEDDWTSPEPLLELRAPAGEQPAGLRSPAIAPDGKTLLFASNRDGGSGGYDLWMAKLTTTTSEPPNLLVKAKQPVKKMVEERPSKSKAEKTPEKTPSAKTKPKPEVIKSEEGNTVGAEISDWLMLGPVAYTQSKPSSLFDLLALKGERLLVQPVREGDKGVQQNLKWTRSKQPTGEGLYYMTATVQVDSARNVRLVVESAPGGGVAWVDRDKNQFDWGVGRLWSPMTTGARESEMFRLGSGRRRVAALICVGDPKVPVRIRLMPVK